MDDESRWQKIEAQVHQARTRMWVVLLIILALCLDLLPANALHAILTTFVLIAVVYLVVSAISGLWQFRTSRAANAQRLDRILRETIAERAKAVRQNSNA